MAKSLKIINFTSEDNAEPYEFEFTDDKSTILDVKKFINRKDALALDDEGVKLIEIFWLVVPLPDEILVKDLLDQKAEPDLYVRLPHAADVTVNVSNQPSGKNFIFGASDGFGRY